MGRWKQQLCSEIVKFTKEKDDLIIKISTLETKKKQLLYKNLEMDEKPQNQDKKDSELALQLFTFSTGVGLLGVVREAQCCN